jgi:2-dehydropantoate 2-reductase
MPPANPTTLVGLVSSIPDDQTAIIQPEQNIRISKTSMLQDWEAGRPMELEAVVGAVVELGERLGVPMPSTRAVYACAKLLDERRGQRVLASGASLQPR